MVDPEGGGCIGRLKTWHERQHPKNRVYNLSIPGDTTTGILQRLQTEAAIRKPHLILIQPGTNGAQHRHSLRNPCRTPLEQFTDNIRSIIRTAQSLADVALIGVHRIDDTKTQPFSYWHKDVYYNMDDILHYAERTRSVCAEVDVPYLDLLPLWTQDTMDTFLFADGQHPNVHGHQRMFASLRTFLEQLYAA